MASRIAALVRAGRLEIGPWYVQPDLFLVSGESLVRNLLHGRRNAELLGGGMPVGYLPDSFGLCCQLPAILAGFGASATTMLFSRGMVGETQRLGCEIHLAGAGTGFGDLPLADPQLRRRHASRLGGVVGCTRGPRLLGQTRGRTHRRRLNAQARTESQQRLHHPQWR